MPEFAEAISAPTPAFTALRFALNLGFPTRGSALRFN